MQQIVYASLASDVNSPNSPSSIVSNSFPLVASLNATSSWRFARSMKALIWSGRDFSRSTPRNPNSDSLSRIIITSDSERSGIAISTGSNAAICWQRLAYRLVLSQSTIVRLCWLNISFLLALSAPMWRDTTSTRTTIRLWSTASDAARDSTLSNERRSMPLAK